MDKEKIGKALEKKLIVHDGFHGVVCKVCGAETCTDIPGRNIEPSHTGDCPLLEALSLLDAPEQDEGGRVTIFYSGDIEAAECEAIWTGIRERMGQRGGKTQALRDFATEVIRRENEKLKEKAKAPAPEGKLVEAAREVVDSKYEVIIKEDGMTLTGVNPKYLQALAACLNSSDGEG